MDTVTEPIEAAGVASPRSRSRRWALGFVVATVVVVAITYLADVLQADPQFTSEDVRIASVSSRDIPAFLPSDELDRQIEVFEARVASDPSILDLRLLGGLYLDEARATGSLDSYLQAEEALNRAIVQYPGDVTSNAMLAGVMVSLHDFDGAIDLTDQILAAHPESFAALAVSGDAHLAVGNYETAEARYEQIIDVAAEDPSVLIRRSELARLRGDSADALALAEMAADVIPLFRAREAAFYNAFAAQMAFDVGDLDEAEERARLAFDLDPDSPAVSAGLARVLAAIGDTDRAIELYVRSVDAVPNPTYLAELGDLHALAGDDEAATRRYDTVEVIAQLNADVYDRQLAVFYADHDRNLEEALDITSVTIERRHDIAGYDAHAWALYVNGRYDEAREASDQALSLGTRSASILYHAGLISAALGDDARATGELEAAFAINPAWSPLQVEHARAILSVLQGSS